MIIIREEQMKVFEDAALRRFEDEMVVHSKEFTPRLCKVLGDKQLRVALRQAMERSGTYGFTNRGPIRLYIELMFLCGSDFDTDPQYPAVGVILNAPGDQMLRAEQIYAGVLDYQEKVSGPDAANVRKSLEFWADFVRKPVNFSTNDFVTEMLHKMTRAFPPESGLHWRRQADDADTGGPKRSTQVQFSHSPRGSAGGGADVCLWSWLHR